MTVLPNAGARGARAARSLPARVFHPSCALRMLTPPDSLGIHEQDPRPGSVFGDIWRNVNVMLANHKSCSAKERTLEQ